MRLPGKVRKLLGIDRRADARLVRAALAQPQPKLHLGSGAHIIEGWLNADLERQPGAIRLDATQRYPFADGTFAYIFSEHMIEHVPYASGLAMLKECRRTLRPGGILRLVTPDLERLLALISGEAPEASRYLEFFHGAFGPEGFPPSAVGAINAHFRLWGHQFLYDEATLREVLKACGFDEVSRHPLMSSPQSALCNLENETRYPPGLLDFESLVLEARRPVV